MYRPYSRPWRIVEATSHGGAMTPQQAIIFTLAFFGTIIALIIILRIISKKY